MTQDLYQKAMKYAGDKHCNQKVPGTNSNYLLHISNVAMEVLVAYNHTPCFDLDFAIQVAILHDTIEDTTANYHEIKITFGAKIAEAVHALTKNENIISKKDRMIDSLSRIQLLSNEVGLVKLADRITNLQTPPDHWSHEKIYNYYNEAMLIATVLQDKNDYLNKRLIKKIRDYKQHTINIIE